MNIETLSIIFPNVVANRQVRYAIRGYCLSFTKIHLSNGQKYMIYQSDINNQVLLHAHFSNLIILKSKKDWIVMVK